MCNSLLNANFNTFTELVRGADAAAIINEIRRSSPIIYSFVRRSAVTITHYWLEVSFRSLVSSLTTVGKAKKFG